MTHQVLQVRHILLTGVPGCGKTTLLRGLVRELRRFHPSGFYTEEIRMHGQRKGFRLVGLNGVEGLLAHADFRGGPRVGKYGVDVGGFESFLDALKLDQVATPLIFIDEIGKMECLSARFADLMWRLLDSRRNVIATVALKGKGLIIEVKQRADVTLVEVDPVNRDGLLDDLANRIKALMGEKL
jgi:nucleoside-triphosphatase